MIALSHDPSGGRLLASLRALREPPALRAPVVARDLRTPRLLLRSYRLTDDADWMRIEGDERIRCGLGWPLRTEREALRHLRDRTRHQALSIPGDLLVLAVERDGHVIGDVSLHLRTTAAETRTAEIGWLQLTSACGHGYATEAARAMLEFAFRDLEAAIVTAVIDSTNATSAALAARLGFLPAQDTGRRMTFVLTAASAGLTRVQDAQRCEER